jgi:hypothetical protein
MPFRRGNRYTSLILFPFFALTYYLFQITPVVIAFSSSCHNPPPTIPSSSLSSIKNYNDEDCNSDNRLDEGPPSMLKSSLLSVPTRTLDSQSNHSQKWTDRPNHRRRQVMLGIARTMVAAVAGGSITAQPSNAAADTTMGVGGVKISKRAGGLAQKIRVGVCFKMVRIVDIIYFASFA